MTSSESAVTRPEPDGDLAGPGRSAGIKPVSECTSIRSLPAIRYSFLYNHSVASSLQDKTAAECVVHQFGSSGHVELLQYASAIGAHGSDAQV